MQTNFVLCSSLENTLPSNRLHVVPGALTEQTLTGTVRKLTLFQVQTCLVRQLDIRVVLGAIPE